MSSLEVVKGLEENIRMIEAEKSKNAPEPFEVEEISFIQPEEFGISTGTYTKSNIYPFYVQTRFLGGKDLKEIYIIKEYKHAKNSEKNYYAEKLIYPIIKSERIFADIIYSEDNKLRLYFEGIMLKPLNKRLAELSDEKKPDVIDKAFDPVIKCFKNLGKYKEQIEKALNTKDIKFQKLDKAYYIGKLGSYVHAFRMDKTGEIADIFKSKKNKIVDSLTDESIYAIGSVDAHPQHNLVAYPGDEDGKLLDIEGLRELSMGMHLGCMLGHPSVYNILPDRKEYFPLIIRRFRNKYNSNIDEKILSDAVYSGSIMNNLREASGFLSTYGLKYIKNIESNLNTIKEQMEKI